MRHVVIAGAGFGGLRLARALRNQRDIFVTLINDSTDFRYTPALYRAATGFKMIGSKLPLDWLISDINNINLVINHVESINSKQKEIILADNTKIKYDTAVLSLGSITTYFNIEGLHEHSFGIKSPDEVIRLKNHIHKIMQQSQDSDCNYVIIGGGATGVELAAALGAYVKKVAKKHHTKHHRINVFLVEAESRILPYMSEKASKIATLKLHKLGIKILLDNKITKETINNLMVGNLTIPTHTVIWTAGTINNPFFENNSSQFKLNEQGKVIVNKQLKSNNDVFVIGDSASTKFGNLALTAILQANFVAKCLAGNDLKEYKQQTPIQIIPLGKKDALLQWNNVVMAGKIPHLIRQLADILGYADIMGLRRAISMKRMNCTTEESCTECNKTLDSSRI